jgi:Tfp pilus assembly protein PilF
VARPAEAAAAIRASAARDALVEALDDWSRIAPGPQGVALRALADAADGEAWRRELRAAARSGDRAALARLADDAVGRLGPAGLASLGVTLLHAGDLAGARRVLAGAQKRHPADFWLAFDLAFCWAQPPARSDEAVRLYTAALALRPDSAVVHNNLGCELVHAGRLEEAADHFRAAVRLGPELSGAVANLGSALLDLGRPADALPHLSAALARDPSSPGLYRNRSMALLRLRRLDEAEDDIRAALRLSHDKMPEAHNSLGNVLATRGDHAAAEASFAEAVRLRPEYGEAHFNRGNSLIALRRPAAAEASLREAVRLLPRHPQAQNNLGFVLNRQGRDDEAEAVLRVAVGLDLTDAEVWINLGSSLFELGRGKEAEAACREAVRLASSSPLAAVWHGRALALQGRYAEAAAEVRRGTELGRLIKGWSPPPEGWVGEAERRAALTPRLDDFLAGTVKAATAAEGVEWGDVCAAQGRPAAAARAYAAAFAAGGPELARPHRFHAASAAARAGCGLGKDAPTDDAARAALRAQALGWLREAAASWRRRIAEGPEEAAKARVTLRRWRTYEPLPLRRPETLALLPAAERAAWEALWADVNDLIRLAGPSP